MSFALSSVTCALCVVLLCGAKFKDGWVLETRIGNGKINVQKFLNVKSEGKIIILREIRRMIILICIF